MKGHFNSNELPASHLLKNLTDFCYKGTYTIYNSTDNIVKKKKKCHDKNCSENHGNNDHRNGNLINEKKGKFTNSENTSTITVKNKTKLFSQKVINKEIKMKKKDDNKNMCYTEEYDYNRVEEGGENDSDNDDEDEEEEEFLSNNVRYVKEEEGGQEGRGEGRGREDRNNDANDSDNTDDETEGHLLFAYSVRRKKIEKEIEINEEHSSEGVAADRVHLMKGSTIGASDR